MFCDRTCDIVQTQIGIIFSGFKADDLYQKGDENDRMKELKDTDLEKVSGGIGFDFENDFKPMEVDLPWWQRGPESPSGPPSTGDPTEQQCRFQDEGVPSW